MRDSAVRVSTMSLSATRDAVADAAAQHHALVVLDRGRRDAASSAANSSGRVISVRKPSEPKLTPRIGTSRPLWPMMSAIASRVPSPPRTSTRSTSDSDVVAVDDGAIGGRHQRRGVGAQTASTRRSREPALERDQRVARRRPGCAW